MPIGSRTKRVADALHAALVGALSRPDAQFTGDVEVAAFDVFAIVKGMVDAAGEREESMRHNSSVE